jgi:SAM-dependent methyltransferase
MSQPDSEQQPKPIGSSPKVFPLVGRILDELSVKTVLDCPAGRGPMVAELLDRGYQLRACDILPDTFRVQGVTCDFADLNESLPYENDTFDAVTCLNGLQRVWARGRAVRELARVVKPGGYLIISMPNHGDLRRRLLYFMTGSASWTVVGPPQVCPPEAEVPAAHYRYAMTLANVLSALTSVGMRFESLHTTNVPLSNVLFSPLAVPIWLAGHLAPRKYRDFFYLKPASTFAAMFGAYLVVVARKPEQA